MPLLPRATDGSRPPVRVPLFRHAGGWLRAIRICAQRGLTDPTGVWRAKLEALLTRSGPVTPGVLRHLGREMRLVDAVPHTLGSRTDLTAADRAAVVEGFVAELDARTALNVRGTAHTVRLAGPTAARVAHALATLAADPAWRAIVTTGLLARAQVVRETLGWPVECWMALQRLEAPAAAPPPAVIADVRAACAALSTLSSYWTPSAATMTDLRQWIAEGTDETRAGSSPRSTDPDLLRWVGGDGTPSRQAWWYAIHRVLEAPSAANALVLADWCAAAPGRWRPLLADEILSALVDWVTPRARRHWFALGATGIGQLLAIIPPTASHRLKRITPDLLAALLAELPAMTGAVRAQVLTWVYACGFDGLSPILAAGGAPCARLLASPETVRDLCQHPDADVRQLMISRLGVTPSATLYAQVDQIQATRRR